MVYGETPARVRTFVAARVQNSQFSAADKFFVNFVLARMQVPHLPRALFAPA